MFQAWRAKIKELTAMQVKNSPKENEDCKYKFGTRSVKKFHSTS